MTRLLILLAALLALPAAATKPPTIRGLFVGIDKYLYSRTTNPQSAGFSDLKGAVGDVGRIKTALRTAYRLDFDQPVAGTCTSQNAVSITLTDTCATRDAILGNLQKLIDASAAGDTLIFYYAGHGSQIADDQVFDQASGMNDTILPTDARKPGAESDGDILDREFRGYIDEANAKGVNVVTIFDSCDSGTGTRAGPIDNDPGVDRAARPLLVTGKIVRPAPPLMRGPGGGYRVHLAASADGSAAREVAMSDGARGGVFTTALVQTMVAMPNATFGDIMAEVTLRVAEDGRPGQVPQVEGAVTATLGGKERSVPLFDATPRGGDVALAAGTLSGMTVGSTFAFFASAGEALAEGGKPVATGTVATVDATTATVTLDAPAASLPARLVGREVNHAYGSATLLLRIGAERPADKAIIAKALAGVSFVRVAEPATIAVNVYIGSTNVTAYLSTIDGSGIIKLGAPTSADFGGKLGDALRKIMRVQAMLALRTSGGADAPGLCIDNNLDYDLRRCPQSGAGTGFRLTAGADAKLTLTNTASTQRYLYVYAIDAAYEINLLVPGSGGKDPAIAPNTPVTVTVQPEQTGRYRFVTIATDAPIASARALEQAGERGVGSCRSALERLVCEAASGTRDPTIPRVGAWIATVTDVVVNEGKKP